MRDRHPGEFVSPSRIEGTGRKAARRGLPRAGAAAIVAVLLSLAAAASAQAYGSAQGPPALPTSPPFTQCPAIGKDSSCGYLIVVTSATSAEILQDPGQSYYDLGEDDVTVGVQNDSNVAVTALHVGVEDSHDGIFGFDWDGICSGKFGPYPSPEGCPFGPYVVPTLQQEKEPDPGYDYAGPDAELLPANEEEGQVLFSTALEPGQYTFFSLEAPPKGLSIDTGVAGQSPDDTIKTELTDVLPNASGVKERGASLSALEPTEMTDQATVVGPYGSEAGGEVEYKVYSDPNCEHLVANAGREPVVNGVAAPSSPVGKELEPNAHYFWRAAYSGAGPDSPNMSTCGGEVMTFGTPMSGPVPTVSTLLSGGGQQGAQLTVPPGTTIADQASITVAGGLPASGRVTYAISAACSNAKITPEGGGNISGTGAVPASNALTLPAGTYYFQVFYSGSATVAAATSACGSEVLKVTSPPSPPAVTPTGAPKEKRHPIVYAASGEIETEYEFPEGGEAEQGGEVVGSSKPSLPMALSASALSPFPETNATKCKKGYAKKAGKCVKASPMRYPPQKLTLAQAGVYKFRIKPGKRIIAALKLGKTLDVKLKLKFTPAGTSDHLASVIKVEVRLKPKRKKAHLP